MGYIKGGKGKAGDQSEEKSAMTVDLCRSMVNIHLKIELLGWKNKGKKGWEMGFFGFNFDRQIFLMDGQD